MLKWVTDTLAKGDLSHSKKRWWDVWFQLHSRIYQLHVTMRSLKAFFFSSHRPQSELVDRRFTNRFAANSNVICLAVIFASRLFVPNSSSFKNEMKKKIKILSHAFFSPTLDSLALLLLYVVCRRLNCWCCAFLMWKLTLYRHASGVKEKCELEEIMTAADQHEMCNC